ncbi:Eye-specific diacylglycerol kinase [Araneus ventricosus]|uniref:Diacylglycerol kinase n=1 Tax=Araneus ventricosus TaxID=182803 RepID=A0A4Y2FPB5_ARAVE|nr:Eye-specific diacylglycerol kinase [Araneus ventricosus]
MASPNKTPDDENEGERNAKLHSLTPNWGIDAKNNVHLWCRSSASGDLCYVSSNVCLDRGHRMKCSSCRIIVHEECRSILIDKMKIMCRPTFQDAEIGSYRENTATSHHWIARPTPKGRCRTCGKTFGSKVCSLLNETVAMSCSWCKEVCHNKDSCFNPKKMSSENCNLGAHANLIVPPTWIVKLPCKETENSKQVFAIKPIPSSSSKPLLVFINPKSGGNQGSKLLRTFQWLLNPRQVFDLTEGGPSVGLDLYKRVPNLRILACGGDGTVGWILSVLDDLKVSTSPPIAVLPLGTGNDLARSLGWGGGYTDEPLTKILSNIEDGEIVKLDRWILNVGPNPKVELSSSEEGRKTLPLNVVNNYFSLGVDARIALEFHEAREAKPGKFNSRFRNKMFYGQAGGKDLIQRKWKDLSNYVTLECDGQDMTNKLKEMKVHSILFLNISNYGGGTKPWGASVGHFQTPATDDGMIEVIGLTTYQLPLLQAGGHGSSIAQCKKAKLVTSCTIPVQVDGEPCRMLPSVIEIELLNTVNMIAKTKKHGTSTKKESVEKISLPLKLLTFQKYESEHHRKENLENDASSLGSVSISYDTDLSEIRPQISSLLKERDSKTASENQENGEGKAKDSQKTANWWFLDSCSGAKFFRIDEAQEHLYYVNDICDQELYIAEQREPADDVNSDATKAEPDEDDVSHVSTSSSSRHSQGSGDYGESRESLEPTDTQAESNDLNVESSHSKPESSESNIKQSHSIADPLDSSTVSSDSDIQPSDSNIETTNSTLEMLPYKDEIMDVADMDLIAAAKMGNLEQVARLHSEGHSLMQRDHEGRTALHHAAFIGNVDVVRYLVAYAPISVLDAQDDIMFHTALHRAATRMDKVVCSILVSAGASLDIKDKQGYTAQELADVMGDHVLAEYLKRFSFASPSESSLFRKNCFNCSLYFSASEESLILQSSIGDSSSSSSERASASVVSQ